MDADGAEPVPPLSMPALVQLASEFEAGGNDAVVRAKATIADRWSAVGTIDEASAEQTVSTFERAIRSKATWGVKSDIWPGSSSCLETRVPQLLGTSLMFQGRGSGHSALFDIRLWDVPADVATDIDSDRYIEQSRLVMEEC